MKSLLSITDSVERGDGLRITQLVDGVTIGDHECHLVLSGVPIECLKERNTVRHRARGQFPFFQPELAECIALEVECRDSVRFSRRFSVAAQSVTGGGKAEQPVATPAELVFLDGAFGEEVTFDCQHRVQWRQNSDEGDAVCPGSPCFLCLSAEGDIHAGRFFVVEHVLSVHLVVPFIGQCFEAISFTRNALFPVVDARIIEGDKSTTVRQLDSLGDGEPGVSDGVVFDLGGDLAQLQRNGIFGGLLYIHGFYGFGTVYPGFHLWSGRDVSYFFFCLFASCC